MLPAPMMPIFIVPPSGYLGETPAPPTEFRGALANREATGHCSTRAARAAHERGGSHGRMRSLRQRLLPVLPGRRRRQDSHLRQLRMRHPRAGPGLRALRLQDRRARDRGERHLLLLRPLRPEGGCDHGGGPRRRRALMRRLPVLCALLLAGCGGERGASPSAPDPTRLDPIARRYVVLALALGHHDPNFVDAYYGPDSLKVAADAESLSVPQVRAAAESLIAVLGDRIPTYVDSLVGLRHQYLRVQLGAMATRAR